MVLDAFAGLVVVATTQLFWVPPPPHSLPPGVNSMIRDVNAERQKAGLPPLLVDAKLIHVAQARATDMVKRNYFSHTQPDGRTPADIMAEDGCVFSYAGENIAMAPDEREAVTALWGSPEHRENTLDLNYHKVGIAIAAEADGTKVFVEDFSD